MYRTAFANIDMTAEDRIAQGDRVVTRWTGRGTDKGDLMGIAPTGKHVAVTSIAIDRIESGTITEGCEVFDQMRMMQQLGVIPTPEQGES